MFQGGGLEIKRAHGSHRLPHRLDEGTQQAGWGATGAQPSVERRGALPGGEEDRDSPAAAHHIQGVAPLGPGPEVHGHLEDEAIDGERILQDLQQSSQPQHHQRLRHCSFQVIFC